MVLGVLLIALIAIAAAVTLTYWFRNTSHEEPIPPEPILPSDIFFPLNLISTSNFFAPNSFAGDTLGVFLTTVSANGHDADGDEWTMISHEHVQGNSSSSPLPPDRRQIQMTLTNDEIVYNLEGISRADRFDPSNNSATLAVVNRPEINAHMTRETIEEEPTLVIRFYASS